MFCFFFMIQAKSKLPRNQPQKATPEHDQGEGEESDEDDNSLTIERPERGRNATPRALKNSSDRAGALDGGRGDENSFIQPTRPEIKQASI